MNLFSFHRPQPAAAKSSRAALRTFAVAAALAAVAPAGFGCSVCGCSLSSDWALQGYGAQPGAQMSVRYEYFAQTDLRSGAGEADRAALTTPNAQEIQQDTLNRNIWLGFNYTVGPAWSWNVQLPYYDRFHSTIAPGDTAVSTSRADGLGDLRLMGRWQTAAGVWQRYGVQFGLKLPTGRFDQNFAAGPAAGTPLDRGLQLGTGTTDALLGAFASGRFTTSLGYFAQLLLDAPLAARDGYRPGANLGFNTGIRFLTAGWLTPQIQVNALWDGRETGVNADYGNSGDVRVYVSPGLTADFGRRMDAFLFLQLPVYQRVNGLQLEARWLLTLGWECKL